MSEMKNMSTEIIKENSGQLVNVEFVPPDILMTGAQRRMMEIIIDMTFNFIIAFIGIFSNVIVISVFTKQGFKDSVGISMTTIAAWDLVKSLGGAMQRMAGPIGIWSPSSAASWSNISLVIFNYLVSFSTYVASVLASYVAVERCLCVTMPLKVKWMLTPKVSFIVCGVISFVVFGCFAVIFGIYDVVWVWDPRYNATIAVYQYNAFSTSHSAELFGYYNLSGTLWPLASLVVIVVSALIISTNLRKASKFRNQYNHGGTTQSNHAASDNTKPNASTLHNPKVKPSLNPKVKPSLNPKVKPSLNPKVKPSLNPKDKSSAKPMSTRDQKVVKMLLVIIVLYIINLSPRCAHYLAKYFKREYYYLRQYHNLASAMAYIVFFFDYLNGAVGLFVFLSMSSSFRATYKQMFPYCSCNRRK